MISFLNKMWPVSRIRMARKGLRHRARLVGSRMGIRAKNCCFTQAQCGTIGAC
jgi:hypothetical protein